MSNKVSTCNSYTYYKHHISQYIYIYIYVFLTISTHLKNISNTLPITYYKNPFLWKIYIYNAKSPSYERQKLIKLKVLLIEGNITHTWLKNQKSITWGKSFKCMMKGDKFNEPMHTAGHTLSPSSCTHFSLSNMKSP